MNRGPCRHERRGLESTDSTDLDATAFHAAGRAGALIWQGRTVMGDEATIRWHSLQPMSDSPGCGQALTVRVADRETVRAAGGRGPTRYRTSE